MIRFGGLPTTYAIVYRNDASGTARRIHWDIENGNEDINVDGLGDMVRWYDIKRR